MTRRHLPIVQSHASIGFVRTAFQRVLPIDSGTNGISRIAVGQILNELEHGDQRQAPKAAPLVDLAPETSAQVTIVEQRLQLVLHSQVGIATRNAARATCAVCSGIDPIGSGCNGTATNSLAPLASHYFIWIMEVVKFIRRRQTASAENTAVQLSPALTHFVRGHAGGRRGVPQRGKRAGAD